MAGDSRTPLAAVRRALALWQGLRRSGSDPCQAVADHGLLRTLGGVDVYLSLAARVGGVRRAEIDQAVEAGRLRVVPSVRGCIYLVPSEAVSCSLRVADLLSRSRREREHEKVGLSAAEVQRLGAAVLEALAGGALTTSALRRALPENLVRGFGAAGKKVGISSNLPPTLRELELEGRLERALEGGCLDSERYLWRLPASDPFCDHPVPD
ncbi:MAG: crosslink repair DNA glycosylase YcaQ family protein, partial [Thermoanaerobaculia bacterium]|nr:crosslink repair DNA glycosylase YcaQ family protein [Thermoanaerobaculia bacterium]